MKYIIEVSWPNHTFPSYVAGYEGLTPMRGEARQYKDRATAESVRRHYLWAEWCKKGTKMQVVEVEDRSTYNQ